MTDRKLYYFAHPFTVLDSNGARNRAAEHARFLRCAMRTGELIKRGFNVFSPICQFPPVEDACPEFLMGGGPDWLSLDMQIIERCRFDGIVLAPGWEKSAGCVAEMRAFVLAGLPVLYYADLVRAVPDDWEGDRSTDVNK